MDIPEEVEPMTRKTQSDGTDAVLYVRVSALDQAENGVSLDDQGVPSKRGGQWRASTVRYILA